MALNEIGNVEAYEIISVNPITSETTTFKLDKNLTINPCASYEEVATASQSITGLTTATYSDTVLKTNVSVAKRIEDLKPAPEPEPDYNNFPSRTFTVQGTKAPNGYSNNTTMKIPTNFTEDNLPVIQGVRAYFSGSLRIGAITPSGFTKSAGIYYIQSNLYHNSTTVGNSFNFDLYIYLSGVRYLLYGTLEIIS